MRVFAISDIHIDFLENSRWFYGLSKTDYKEDILILAGDITNKTSSFIRAFVAIKKRFREVFYIPGNHDLWTNRKQNNRDSLENFRLINTIASNCGVKMEPGYFGSLSIVPLFAWYDYTFGKPTQEIQDIWMDYAACKWPEGYDDVSITHLFLSMNEPFLSIKNDHVISFSHFLPRIDLMPVYIPRNKRILFPVLGTELLEKQIRRLGPDIHIYGHSHVNVRSRKDGIVYINNAYGYPSEKMICAKKLLKIFEI